MHIDFRTQLQSRFNARMFELLDPFLQSRIALWFLTALGRDVRNGTHVVVVFASGIEIIHVVIPISDARI